MENFNENGKNLYGVALKAEGLLDTEKKEDIQLVLNELTFIRKAFLAGREGQNRATHRILDAKKKNYSKRLEEKELSLPS